MALLRPLWQWQHDAQPEVLRRDRLALFWEMRLGKTIMALRWLYADADRLPALVVSPLSVCRGWCDEATADGVLQPTFARGTDRQLRDLLADDPPLVVVNYDLLWRRPSLLRHGWSAVILDESPLIRNPQAKRTKAIQKHLGGRNTPHVCLLSGYPAPQTPLDYFEQGRFLSPTGRFMGYDNFWQFRRDHARPAGPFEWYVPVDVQRRIKNELKPFALWLTRRQAGMNIEKVRSVRYVVLPQKDRRSYRAAEEEFIVNGYETKYAVVVATQLRRLCGGDHKVKELVSLASGELRAEPLVVWCYFRDEIKRCRAALEKAGRVPVHIHGGTGGILRDNRVSRFQDGTADTIVAQMDCARYGLNFSRADTVINFSRSWQPDSNWQSEDRIVHGSKAGKSVFTVDLVTEDSIDEHVRDILFSKRAKSRTFLAKLHARTRNARRR